MGNGSKRLALFGTLVFKAENCLVYLEFFFKGVCFYHKFVGAVFYICRHYAGKSFWFVAAKFFNGNFYCVFFLIKKICALMKFGLAKI